MLNKYYSSVVTYTFTAAVAKGHLETKQLVVGLNVLCQVLKQMVKFFLRDAQNDSNGKT